MEFYKKKNVGAKEYQKQKIKNCTFWNEFQIQNHFINLREVRKEKIKKLNE